MNKALLGVIAVSVVFIAALLGWSEYQDAEDKREYAAQRQAAAVAAVDAQNIKAYKECKPIMDAWDNDQPRPAMDAWGLGAAKGRIESCRKLESIYGAK